MVAALLCCRAFAAEIPGETSLPEDRSTGISYASLTFTGISDDRFHPLKLTLEAHLHGSVFSARAGDVSVMVNDVPVTHPEVRVADDFLSASIRLRRGLNEVVVTALDQNGALLAADVLAWAGDRRLEVNVVDRALRPLDDVEVELILADDHHVRLTTVSVSGRAEFQNLPPAAMLLRARSPGRSPARTVVEPGQTSLIVVLAEVQD